MVFLIIIKCTPELICAVSSNFYCIVLLLCLPDTVNAINNERVVVALINESTFFNCSTTSNKVEWFSASDPIYTFGEVRESYKNRFRVENYTDNHTKFFNLILHSVTKEDGGQICICEDPVDKGRKVHRLTVLGICS